MGYVLKSIIIYINSICLYYFNCHTHFFNPIQISKKLLENLGSEMKNTPNFDTNLKTNTLPENVRNS